MGLMDILNGMQNGPRGDTSTSSQSSGGMSPVTMAMLALLAYKAYQKMNSGQPDAAPANAPAAPAGGIGGGLGGLLGGLLGGGAAAGAGASGGIGGLGDILKGGLGNMGGLGGSLGGLLAGGAGGSVLSQGLNDVLKQLEQNGHGDVAQSWVGTGANKQISPEDLGKALGDETTASLAEQAGLSKVELLQGMSQQLPHLVNQLTPDGRVPNEHEMSRLI
jgi:uncharacterized protein YidB (DUF937 family)